MASKPAQIKRGDTWDDILEYTDEDTGLPIDVTGAHASLMLRKVDQNTGVISTTSSLEGDSDTGDILVGDTDGLVTLAIHYTKTEALEADAIYACDVQLTFANDVRRSTDTFFVKVAGDITYST